MTCFQAMRRKSTPTVGPVGKRSPHPHHLLKIFCQKLKPEDRKSFVTGGSRSTDFIEPNAIEKFRNQIHADHSLSRNRQRFPYSPGSPRAPGKCPRPGAPD